MRRSAVYLSRGARGFLESHHWRTEVSPVRKSGRFIAKLGGTKPPEGERRFSLAFTAINGQTRSSLAEINIIPLVYVVLVLLVIFMITAPVLQSGIEVNVPKTRTVKQITEQRMVVTIDREQNVFLNDQPVNVHDLPARLLQGR